MPPPPVPFPEVRFKGKLRPSQEDVVKIARRKLAAGSKKLHIVAPPGSGKTVTGLFLWADCVKKPALVLAPNSAIQAQWAARTDLFDFPGGLEGIVSTDPQQPALLTSLTYQSVTLPRSGGEDLEELAKTAWRENLIAKGQAKDPEEATIWIEDLKQHNSKYYEKRLSVYRKQARDATAAETGSLAMLHRSSLETLERLRVRGVGLVILDECHHLMGHWGRVLADVRAQLNDPVIVGLTATPPDTDGHPPTDVTRYEEFFGPIDYDVPVPAVVKDGFLAPYQDLAYFVRPRDAELKFIADADDELKRLVSDLCQVPDAEDGEEDDVALSPTSKVKESAAAKTARRDPKPGPPPLPVKLRASDLSPPVKAPPPLPEDEPDDEPEEASSSADEVDESAEAAREIESPPSVAPGKSAAAARFEPLPDWLIRVLTQRLLPTGKAKDWASFEKRDPQFVLAARWFLQQCHVPQLLNVPPPDRPADAEEVGEMALLVPVLDRYIRHRLRRSSDPTDQVLAERAIARLRLLGVQITETGSQACASPVGRVLAYSQAKADALREILESEYQSLGDKIRAVIVADYEKTSATRVGVEHLLDDEAGGAVAAFKLLVRDPFVDQYLQPVLVTGSTLLVDDDISEQFDAAAQEWLAKQKFEVDLEFGEEQGFHSISGSGEDWCPRVYVAMVTELFQRGLTKCLVGTRGLLGEGWDASKVNVLVDLTTVTTSMTVNQLRGRSIRLDSDDPNKLANNWDVVCLAPEFAKGLDDYHRFMAKHLHLFGITDDGAVEKGVGHVHPAFTELKPEGVEGSMQVLNEEMLARVKKRADMRNLWRIGQPYQMEPVQTVEAKPMKAGKHGGFPPFSGSSSPWAAASLTLSIGQAVLAAMRESKIVTTGRDVKVGERSGGYVRAFLEDASEEDSRRFAGALREALGPLENPRYVLPREVDVMEETWMSKMMPEVIGKYFHRRVRKMAMLHAVPAELATTKERAQIYQRYWNQYVSPGEVVYAHRDEGKLLLERARRYGMVPSHEVREKEVFL